MEEKESSNNDASHHPELSRKDSEEDIYAQLDRLDESLNNELEELKRMLSKESTSATTTLQVSENGDANEPDVQDPDACANNEVKNAQPQNMCPAQNRTDTTGKSREVRKQRTPQRGKRNNTRGSPRGKEHKKQVVSAKKNDRNQKRPDDSNATPDKSACGDEIVAQPQPQSQSTAEEVNDKSKGTQRQRNSQRWKRNNTRDSPGNKQQKPAISAKKNENQRKQQQETTKQCGVVKNENGMNDNADSSSTSKTMAKSSSSASEKNMDSSSATKDSVDSPSSPNKSQPKRMEGRGRGSRRRQALQRHQEQEKQLNNDEPTNESTAVKEEGKGRRARARRSRMRREQQKVNDDGTMDKNGAATESRKKKENNLSTEQKQRIIDSLNQGRNNFLSR